MKTIKFSLIVCAYNEEKILGECLNSVKFQNYDNALYELIIIDNESSDKTEEIALSFFKEHSTSMNIQYYRISHVGLSSSRNFAISKARGEFLIFIDGDALSDSKLIQEYEKTFLATNCDYSGGRVDLLNTDSRFAKLLQNTKYRQVFTGPRMSNYLHGANMAFKKSIFKKYKFIENFYSLGDESSLVSLLVNEYRYAPCQDGIVYHERPENLKDFFQSFINSMKLSYKVAVLLKQINGQNLGSFYKSLVSNLFLSMVLIQCFFYPLLIFLFAPFLFWFKRQYMTINYTLLESLFILKLIILEIFLIPAMSFYSCLLYTSPSPRDGLLSRMPSSA